MTYGEKFLAMFYPRFRTSNKMKFMYITEVHFKALIKEYGVRSIHHSCTGIRKVIQLHFTLRANNFLKCALRCRTRIFFLYYFVCVNSTDHIECCIKRLRYTSVYRWKLLKGDFVQCLPEIYWVIELEMQLLWQFTRFFQYLIKHEWEK